MNEIALLQSCLKMDRSAELAHPLKESVKRRQSATTQFELADLEDQVALAAAKVQNTESEVCPMETTFMHHSGPLHWGCIAIIFEALARSICIYWEMY